MYIKSITLEGFKSYRDRTVVGPFDRHFNAITGLNGSGKSNILDAVCFVLGINSLQTVRATCLADLIYKGGGATRAAVSITLDNSDKTIGQCPTGFEDYAEIVVSRVVDQKLVSKYYLNSLTSTKNAVVDLFGSVRLDVNNPNFMIMQGKITKVVNMKPKEILQMIEETVGATIYQHKRDKAKAIQDGFGRSRESLHVTMNDTIKPAWELQKLAAVQAAEYNELVSRLDAVESQYAIKMYLYLIEKFNHVCRKKDGLIAKEQEENKEKQALQDSVKRMKDKKEQLHEKFKSLPNVKMVEKEMSTLSRKHASDEAKLNSSRLNKKDSAKALRQAKQEYQSELEQIKDFEVKQKSLIDEFVSCQTLITNAEQKVAEAEQKFEKINYGNIIDEDGNTVNIQEEVSEIEKAIRDLKGPNEIKKRELARDAKVIEKKEEVLRRTPTDDQVERDYLMAQNRVHQLNEDLRRLNIAPGEMTNLDTSIHKANLEINRKQSEEDNYFRSYQFLRFRYNDPYRDFDRSRVHGSVYELFEVKDIDKYKVALEVVAGGSFAQVVVDTPDTSKALVAKGDLRSRTTFQPLSALLPPHRRNVTQRDLDKKFGANAAFFALDLIKYDSQYDVLMDNIFGYSVICTTMEIAKSVAYKMGYKAVTLDGDMVDPGGLMQGGTRKNAGNLLLTCQSLRSLKLEIAELTQNVAQWKKQREMCNRNAKLVQQHDEAVRNLQSCKELRDLTTHATLSNDLKALKKQYAENEANLMKTGKELAALMQKEKSLKQKLQNQEQLRIKSRQKVEGELKKWNRELQLARKQKESKDSLYRGIEIDLKSKAASLKDCQKEITEAEKNDEECRLTLEAKEAEFQNQLDEYNQKMEAFQEEIRCSKEFEAKIEHIDHEVDRIDRHIHELDITKMKRDVQVKQTNEKYEDLKTSIRSFVSEYPTIEFREDMQATSHKSVAVLKDEVDHLKSRKEDMRSKLNLKAAEALPKTEKEVQRIHSMLEKLTINNNYFDAIVKRLDIFKMNLVETAYIRINEEFGFMMETLLPESTAKLVQVNPRNLSDGVLIHVRLGGVWKESLTELSGGQRSLVALSLMLSLCMYNPAPFYVLDEIDSALDLNHTSNIGYLIKTKFTNVQFICVSLKDGMFNRANVIFRTGFENGTSTVKASIRTKKKGQQSGEERSSSTSNFFGRK